MATGKAPSLLRELAHELRDALSPVRAALDLMRVRGFAPEVGREMAPRIEQGLARALATVDAFVLAELCESGMAAVALAPVPLARLLERALAEIAAPQRARCRLPRPLPEVEVVADVARGAQVLTAILQHALAAAAADAPVEVRATSSDDGAEVRVAFAAAREPSEDSFGSFHVPPGSGLMALRTARCLMRLQQGDLQWLDQPPTGAELVAGFRRPGATAVAGRVAEAPDSARVVEAPHSARAANGGGIRLLMVEDNPDVRRAYREALAAMGYEVSEAGNAAEALSAAAATTPRVALIDINLPGMNGYRLAQTLRDRASGEIRLVMLSGVTLDEVTLQLSRQAGFDQCFDKAAGPKALHALLTRLL